MVVWRIPRTVRESVSGVTISVTRVWQGIDFQSALVCRSGYACFVFPVEKNVRSKQSNCELAHNVTSLPDAIIAALRPARLYAIDPLMKSVTSIICICSILLLGACSEELPPVSVSEFADNPRLLEATMVRCAANRAETRYDVECINAREAVNRIDAAEQRIRRSQFEEQSERKRQALRRTQEAAAAARRRAIEEQQRREEEQYLDMFEGALSGEVSEPAVPDGALPDNPDSSPPEIIPSSPDEPSAITAPIDEPSTPPGSDLNAIREELKRRQESPPE